MGGGIQGIIKVAIPTCLEELKKYENVKTFSQP